jgi:hypothetical protein
MSPLLHSVSLSPGVSHNTFASCNTMCNTFELRNTCRDISMQIPLACGRVDIARYSLRSCATSCSQQSGLLLVPWLLALSICGAAPHGSMRYAYA